MLIWYMCSLQIWGNKRAKVGNTSKEMFTRVECNIWAQKIGWELLNSY